MLKKILVGIIALVLMGAYSVAAQSRDWRTCKTEVIMANTLDAKVTYRVFWVDHDVPSQKGSLIDRCGGELQPYSFDEPSEEFHLCPGEHVVLWWVGNNKRYSYYSFTPTDKIGQVILTPEGPQYSEGE